MPRIHPPARALRAAVLSAVAAGLLSGCGVARPGDRPSGPVLGTAAGTSPQTPSPSRPTPSATQASLTASVAVSPGASKLALLPDRRANRSRPLVVRGLPLINRNHSVSKAFTPKLAKPYALAPDAAAAYARMVSAARKAGLHIVLRVGYRSYATQAALYAHPPAAYGKNADAYVARPGRSEHQAGLAVDVASPAGRGASFPKTKEFAWLRKHSYEYGFVLRYPPGKTSITGYHYEPWHYRYIGKAAASAFGPKSTLTLEEYLGGR